MEPPLLYAIEKITFYLVWLGIPTLIFTLPAQGERRNLTLRFFLNVFATWFGFILHRSEIGLPASYARAEANGNEMYDGVGMNVAILFMGWVPALMSTILVLFIYLAATFVLKRRNRSTLTHTGDEPPHS